MVVVNGREIHYVERGDGRLAVLVHGFPHDHTLYLNQMSPVAQRRRVVAVDLPGYGMSERVTGEPLTMESLADDLAALIAALGFDEADILGLSMGGYAALATWERHPERCRSLVLADTRSEADSEEGRAARDAMASRVVHEGRAALGTELQEALLGPRADLVAHARLRTMVESTPVETIIASLAGMAMRPDRTDMLASISVPTLVIVGEEDGLTPPLDMHEFAAAIPGSEFVVIPGSGHLPPIERPDAFTEALLGFWN